MLRYRLFVVLLLIPSLVKSGAIAEVLSPSEPLQITSENTKSISLSNLPPRSPYRATGLDIKPFWEKIYEEVSEESYYEFLYDLSVNIGPRDWPSVENVQAVEWIQSTMHLVSQGTAVVESWGEHDSIVGILEGYDPSLADVIVIGAHMDSVNNDCPGADDNASGTALVLEALRVLSQYHFPRDIYFCAFNAEEDWLLGSEDIATILAEAGVGVKMMLNADMILWDPLGTGLREFIYCRGGNRNERHTAELVQNMSRLYGDDVFLLVQGQVPASDQLSFHQHGFDGVFSIETNFNTANYHQITDTIFHPECNFTLATEVTASFAATVAQLAFEDISPTLDYDNDGLPDLLELEYGTEASNPDTDNDGLLDGEEVNNYHTDPLKWDSDSDNLSDSEEIRTHHTDPLNPDSDEDGLSDGQEVIAWGTNPLNRDTDRDGLTDSDEIIKYGTNPIMGDSDSDELFDGQEIELGTDPMRRDSDGDLIPDGEEVEKNWDPLDPESPGNTENPSKDSSNEFVLPIFLLGLLAVVRLVKRNKNPEFRFPRL